MTLAELGLTPTQTEAAEAFAKHHGLAALLDHLGLDGLGNELTNLTAKNLRLAQALRTIRDTTTGYTHNVATRALTEAGIPDPPDEDHP